MTEREPVAGGVRDLSASSIWALGPSVFLPSLLFATGQGAVMPVLAVAALERGSGVGIAGAMVGLLGLGKMAAAMPAGNLAMLRGERVVMFTASTLICGACTFCALVGGVSSLAVGVLALGCGSALWGLARHTFVTETVPFPRRARTFSVLGGVQRAGAVIGPFLGALAIHLVGVVGAFWTYAATSALAGLLIVIYAEHDSDSPARAENPSTLRVVRDNAAVLSTLGVGALLVSAARISRQAIIPLWGAHIGLSAIQTSVVFGIGAALDLVLVYPGGLLMDRFGRAAVGVPAIAIIGVSYLVTPLTHTAFGLTGPAILAGIGNGLTAGLVTVMGADASPAVARAKFLSIWRLSSDLGEGVGPVVLAATAALATLSAAVLTMGAVSWVAAGALQYWLGLRMAGSRREAVGD